MNGVRRRTENFGILQPTVCFADGGLLLGKRKGIKESMNKKVLVFSLAISLLTTVACGSAPPANSKAAATPAPAASPVSATSSTASDQDFTLVNDTGVVIDKLYISPHDSDDWEEDILGADTLPSGESLEIKFHRAEKAPVWDLRIEDSKGNSIEWENLNLLEIAKITLNYKDGKATAKTE
jgi:hypothetical protein